MEWQTSYIHPSPEVMMTWNAEVKAHAAVTYVSFV
jgi:hypothetical protein